MDDQSRLKSMLFGSSSSSDDDENSLENSSAKDEDDGSDEDSGSDARGSRSVRPMSYMSDNYEERIYDDEADEVVIRRLPFKDDREAPRRMNRGEMCYFQSRVVSSIQRVSSGASSFSDSGDGMEDDSSSALCDDDSPASSDAARSRRRRQYMKSQRRQAAAAKKREEQLELDRDAEELQSLIKERAREARLERLERDNPTAFEQMRSKSRPDMFADVIEMQSFAVFNKNWIPSVLSEPCVHSVFLYLQAKACAGMGAVDAEVLPTLYAAEAFGVRVEIVYIEEDSVLARVYFAPRSLDALGGSKKSPGNASGEAASSSATGADSTAAALDDDAFSASRNLKKGAHSYLQESSSTSFAERLQKRYATGDAIDNDQDFKAFQFKQLRRRALHGERPYRFFWDKSQKTTSEEHERERERQIVEVTDRMSAMTISREEEEKAAVDDDESSSSSSEDDASYDSSDEDGDTSVMNSSRFMGSNAGYESRRSLVPGRKLGQTLTSLSTNITKNLVRLARKVSSEATANHPDAVARSRTEITGWVEDNLCIDVVVFPGLKKRHGEVIRDRAAQDVPRQLVFTFSICNQNPYSFHEMISRELDSGGLFPKLANAFEDDEDKDEDESVVPARDDASRRRDKQGGPAPGSSARTPDGPQQPPPSAPPHDYDYYRRNRERAGFF